jgi:hypothetical protein
MTGSATGFRAAIAAACLGLGGCLLPVIQPTSGRTLAPEALATIRRGRTTKVELLEALGAPLAVASQGETVTVVSPNAVVAASDNAICKRVWGGSFTTGTDGWFEAFALRRTVRDTHRIYYWYEAKPGGWNGLLLVVYAGQCRTTTRHLYALVDERTELVDDVLLVDEGGTTALP